MSERSYECDAADRLGDAEAEILRLRGEQKVLRDLLAQALPFVEEAEDDTEDPCGELITLQEQIEAAIRQVDMQRLKRRELGKR